MEYIKRNAVYGVLLSLHIEDIPTAYPLYRKTIKEFQKESPLKGESLIEAQEYENGFPTISNYYYLYRNKIKTPLEVAKAIIDMVNSDKIKKLFTIGNFKKSRVLAAADESARRYRDGKELSHLDGVPYFVHEEMKVRGLTSVMGTSFYEIECDSNSSVIENLQEKGAICCGYVSMVQFGTNSIGVNPSKARPSVRNPYNQEYLCGGSNSGSACVVASGIVPFSLGVEGIGSIRLTSGVCGVVGFKPTFGRTRDRGTLYAEGSPFTLIGCISTCIRDAAIIYEAISGPNPDHILRYEQPLVWVPDLSKKLIKGTKFGVFPSYIKFASPEFVAVFNQTLNRIKLAEGEVLEINIPELKESFAAAILGFVKVISQSLLLKVGPNVSGVIEDVGCKVVIELGKSINEKNYDTINRQRTRAMNILEKIFAEVDIILLLTCSTLPGKLQEIDERYGVIDETLTNAMTLFTFLASFCGNPAITLNMDYEPVTKLPISLQVISPWWKENNLLEIANNLEQILKDKNLPDCFVNPLNA